MSDLGVGMGSAMVICQIEKKNGHLESKLDPPKIYFWDYILMTNFLRQITQKIGGGGQTYSDKCQIIFLIFLTIP